MTDDEVKGMFLLGAEARRMREDDPRKEQAEGMFCRMKARYLAERVSETRPDPPPAWKSALQYVAALFSQMDAVDPSGRDERRAVWNEISKGVTGFNERAASEAKDSRKDGIIEP